MGDSDDLGVDYQSAWAGAAYGVPVAEAKRIMQECIVGAGRVGELSQASRCTFPQQLKRMDRRLLRDRLSHLAEGTYDLSGDVVRARGSADPDVFPSAPSCQDSAGDSAAAIVFQKRASATSAKRNA